MKATDRNNFSSAAKLVKIVGSVKVKTVQRHSSESSESDVDSGLYTECLNSVIPVGTVNFSLFRKGSLLIKETNSLTMIVL